MTADVLKLDATPHDVEAVFDTDADLWVHRCIVCGARSVGDAPTLPCTRFEQLRLGEQLRDAGMAQTTEAADRQDVAVIDQAIEHLNRRGQPWSANDLRELLPSVRQPLIGARVRSWAQRKHMTHVGYVKSTNPASRSDVVSLWRGRTDGDT